MTCHDLCGKAKRHYDKSFREVEKAQEAYKRAEQDANLSRADIEKVVLYASVEMRLRKLIFNHSIDC